MLKIESHIVKYRGEYAATNSLIPNGYKDTLIKQIGLNGRIYRLKYAWGTTNAWGVPITIDNRSAWLKDSQYFQFLQEIETSDHKVLLDLIDVYHHCGRGYLDDDYFNQDIPRLTAKYGKVTDTYLQILYTYIQLAFTSEYYYVNQRGQYSQMGPKIKLLGFIQALWYGMDAYTVANASRGKAVKTILAEYQQAKTDLGNAGIQLD